MRKRAYKGEERTPCYKRVAVASKTTTGAVCHMRSHVAHGLECHEVDDPARLFATLDAGCYPECQVLS